VALIVLVAYLVFGALYIPYRFSLFAGPPSDGLSEWQARVAGVCLCWFFVIVFSILTWMRIRPGAVRVLVDEGGVTFELERPRARRYWKWSDSQLHVGINDGSNLSWMKEGTRIGTRDTWSFPTTYLSRDALTAIVESAQAYGLRVSKDFEKVTGGKDTYLVYTIQGAS
jgi:hypothetical protein